MAIETRGARRCVECAEKQSVLNVGATDSPSGHCAEARFDTEQASSHNLWSVLTPHAVTLS